VRASATILKHPAFNRPPVKQALPRGRRSKTVVSIQSARIAVKLASEKSKCAATRENSPHTACAQLQQFEALFQSASAESARRMGEFLQAIIDTEINRRIREGMNK
jgi:hypothetical protein